MGVVNFFKCVGRAIVAKGIRALVHPQPCGNAIADDLGGVALNSIECHTLLRLTITFIYR
jgi:hypothetical protein